MRTIMKLEELTSIDRLSQFLDGTKSVIFKLDTVKKTLPVDTAWASSVWLHKVQ